MSVDIEGVLGSHPGAAGLQDPASVVEQEVMGQGEETPPKKKVGKVESFVIEHVSENGHVLKGKFKNKILDVEAHIKVGVIRSRLTGGVPWESLDPVSQSMSMAIAHLSVSLVSAPDWAKNIGAIKDPVLINKIYTEVDSHEAMFRGFVPDPPEGRS